MFNCYLPLCSHQIRKDKKPFRGSPQPHQATFYGYIPSRGPQLKIKFDQTGLFFAKLAWHPNQRRNHWVAVSWRCLLRIKQLHPDRLEFELNNCGRFQLGEKLIQLGILLPVPKNGLTVSRRDSTVSVVIHLARHTGLEFIELLLEANLVRRSRCGFLNTRICFKPNLDID